MKVYYVGNRYDGCYYVRCLHPLIYNGWDGTKTSMRAQYATPERQFQGSMQSDVVVFHRPDDTLRVQTMKLLQQAGKKVVFDNDDTYKSVDAMKFKEQLEHRKGVLDEAIEVADLVTTSTEFLADEYRKINKNVIVIPNCVDPSDWGTPLKNETGKVRIGIIGSTAINKDALQIKTLLKELSARDDVTLVVFALPPNTKDFTKMRQIYKPEIDFWNTLKVEWHHFVNLCDYNDKLRSLRLDMMLIPREDSYFNRCKSNLKFLEASMLEVPIVAQGFKDGLSPYQGKEDAKHMLIAYTEEDWRGMTEKLIQDKGLRENMGKKAKKYVLKNYNIQTNAQQWEDAYNTL